MHFALEERIMRDSGYSEYEDHKDDHEELLDEIRDLMDGFATSAATDTTAASRWRRSSIRPTEGREDCFARCATGFMCGSTKISISTDL